jgi:hypothetical protein
MIMMFSPAFSNSKQVWLPMYPSPPTTAINCWSWYKRSLKERLKRLDLSVAGVLISEMELESDGRGLEDPESVGLSMSMMKRRYLSGYPNECETFVCLDLEMDQQKFLMGRYILSGDWRKHYIWNDLYRLLQGTGLCEIIL